MSTREKQVIKVELMKSISEIECEIKRIKSDINSGKFEEDRVPELKCKLNKLNSELNK